MLHTAERDLHCVTRAGRERLGEELDEDEGEEAAAGEALQLQHRPLRGAPDPSCGRVILTGLQWVKSSASVSNYCPPWVIGIGRPV